MSVQLLAFDTSTSACTVALTAKDTVYQDHAIIPRQHNQYLLSMVQKLLDEAHIDLTDLNGLVVGQGPGSFTGVRIAVSVAQGLALGAGLPVIPISTLQIIAQTAYYERGAEQVLVGWDARLGEVYWGAYRLDPSDLLMHPVISEGLYLPHAVPLPTLYDKQDDHIQKKSWQGIGSAWRAYDTELNKRCVGFLNGGLYPDDYPQARAALALGAQALQEGRSVAAWEAQPCYLRNQVATAAQPGNKVNHPKKDKE